MKSWCPEHGVSIGFRCVYCSPQRAIVALGSFGHGSFIFEPTVVLRPENLFVSDFSRIDSFCKIESGLGVRIGRYVHISSFCHIGIGGGEVWIGNYVGIASGARVLSGSHILDGAFCGSAVAAASEQKRVVSVTRIGNNAFIGAGVTVMPGVRIGDRAVIGAGALVTRDVGDGEVWAGVPAKKLRMRR